MARRTKIYEGKGKIIYEGPETGTLVQHFKDDAYGADGKPVAAIEGKGVLNNRLSEFFMTGLNHVGVPNHLLRRINMREQVIRACEMLPLAITVRNFAAGEFALRLGLEEGMRLPRPIIEFSYKNEKLGNPMVPEEYIMAFGWATQQDLDDMVALSLRINDYMTGALFGVGVKLVDIRLETGRIYEGDFQRLILADEISPDSCRLWDMESGLRYEDAKAGEEGHVYNELARRLGVLPSRVAQHPKIIN